MRILFADDDDDHRQLISMHLTKIFDDLDIVEAISGNRAIAILKEDDNFDLIISDYNMPNGTGGDLFSFVAKNKLIIPFILMSTETSDTLPEFRSFMDHHHLNRNINKPVNYRLFLHSILKLTAKMNLEREIVTINDGNYSRIRLLYFLRYNRVACDIYIKLNKDKFIKLINKNDYYTKADIEKYKSRKLEYLYIREQDYESFSSSVMEMPFLILDKRVMSAQEEEEILLNTQTIIHHLATTVGISKQCINLADAYTKHVLRTTVEHRYLYNLLMRMKDRSDYLYDHSLMLAYICTQACEYMKWETEKIQQKLCYAAIFHDIYLEDVKFAMLDDCTDLKGQKYPKEDIIKYKKHPLQAAKLIRDLDDFAYQDVDEIILHHHENASASGFPHQLSHDRISPVTALFIMANHFILDLYKVNFETEEIPRLIFLLKEKYSKGNYRVPLKALTQFIKDHLEVGDTL